MELAFWKDNEPESRIEIPVEVTSVLCLDPIEVRTADGTIYATISEGDMIESKIMSVFDRTYLRHRDLVDLFLFKNSLLPNSGERLRTKFCKARIESNSIVLRMKDLLKNPAYHIKAVQGLINTQFDPESAAQINSVGGGQVVLDTVVGLLQQYTGTEKSDESD